MIPHDRQLNGTSQGISVTFLFWPLDKSVQLLNLSLKVVWVLFVTSAC